MTFLYCVGLIIKAVILTALAIFAVFLVEQVMDYFYPPTND